MKTISCPSCTLCHVEACITKPGSKKPPKFCAMVQEKTALQKIEKKYLEQPELNKMALAASRTAAAGYMQRTRIEDIIDFAKRMGVKKLGIAHCNGLFSEARIAADIFSKHDFVIYSVCCKVGSIPKEKIGLKKHEKGHPNCFEALCNPIAQAELLNKKQTDLNVMIGLCVGHDSLFFKFSEAPVVVLVVKDRVLGHNPVAALYTANSFYRRLKNVVPSKASKK